MKKVVLVSMVLGMLMAQLSFASNNTTKDVGTVKNNNTTTSKPVVK
ncbi:MAG: hypothetical protein ACK5LP_02800 [Campylobacteraceae bacterium]